MRKAIAVWAVLAGVAIAGQAGAQAPLDQIRAQNAAAHQAEVAHQALLAGQREVAARQDQARTDFVLRELESARVSPPGLVLRGPTAPLAVPPVLVPDSFAVQMDRMERLTQDALARGNARIRAVRPASEQ